MLSPEQASFAGSGAQPSIGTLLAAIWRRRYLFLATFLVLLAAATAAIFGLQPVYQSEAMLLVDSRQPKFSDIPSVVETPPQSSDLNFVRSEQQVLGSDELGRRVVQRLNLDRDPDFIQQPSALSRLVAQVREVLGDGGADAPVTNSLDAAIGVYRQRLSVFNDGKSFVIRVAFNHADPAKARTILASHLDLYLHDQRARKELVIAKAGQWLDQELARLRDKVQQSEQQLQAFRDRNRLVRSGGETISGRQLADVTGQLARSRSDLSRYTARSAEVTGGRPDSAVVNSELIQRLRQQEATLGGDIAQLQQRYGPGYPKLVELQSALADTQSRTRTELARLTTSSSSDVAISRLDVQQLEQQVANLEQQAVATSQAELAASQLDRETEADRRLYSELLARSKQVAIQKEIQEPDARIVSSPSLAVNPAFPRRGLLLVIAAAAVAFVAGGLMLLLDRFRKHTQTLTEIEDYHGITGLGALPRVRQLRLRTMARSDLPLRQPKLAAAIQTISNSIAFRMRDYQSKVVVVASPSHGDGRTSLAVLLARSFSEKGERVLLIDADLRRRDATVRLGLISAPGLVHAMRTASDLQRSIVVGAGSGQGVDVQPGKEFAFDVLPAGREETDPHTVVHRATLRSLLAEARAQYDVIVVDTPPLAEVDDAVALAVEADATVMVVRRGQTSDKILQTAIGRLQLVNARIVGAVLNGTTAGSQGLAHRPVAAGTNSSPEWAKTYLAARQ